VEAALLGKEADLWRVLPPRRAAEHLDCPARRPDDVQYHTQRRRLPRPIAAEEPEHFSRGNAEAQVVDRQNPVEALGHALQRRYAQWKPPRCSACLGVRSAKSQVAM